RYSPRIKNLKFQAVCVELPAVEALAIPIGAPPTQADDRSPFYHMPIIQNPSTGAVVSESAAIAEYFDKTYPASRVTLLISAGTKAPTLVFRKAVAESLFQRVPSSGDGEILNNAMRLYLLKR
ncbi:hypothetical protein EDD18DRAFT_1081104, partial [Armillaria luteobubalina]